MSDRERVLDVLSSEGMPTGEVADAVGIGKPAAGVLLQALAKEGLARCGRGGWRRVGAENEPPEAAEALAPETSPRRKAPKERKPRVATVEQLQRSRRIQTAPATAAAPIDPTGFAFGIDETGALIATDGQQTRRFTPEQTRRLAAFLQRVQPLFSEAA